MTLGLPVVLSSPDQLLQFPSIRLKSWKGDYLHRPDSPQGVTTWNEGIGNEWVPCPGPDGKIILRSWKGDELHRPDSPQGVTTWHEGIGDQWSLELNGETVRLRSWKGDYLHRPDTAQGVTTWNEGIGNEWRLVEAAVATPWPGGEIADGTRILVRTTKYDIGLEESYRGNADYVSAVAPLPWRWNDAVPERDYICAIEPPAAEVDSVFTVRTWPRGPRECMPGNNPGQYQKIILQAASGKFLTTDSSGTYHASAGQDEARVFCLDLTRGNRTLLYDMFYLYRQRATIDPVLHTLASRGSYTARFAKPSPSQPIILQFVQGIADSAVIELLVVTPKRGAAA